MRLPSMALDSGIPARMTGLIVQYLKMNILLGTMNTFTVSVSSLFRGVGISAMVNDFGVDEEIELDEVKSEL